MANGGPGRDLLDIGQKVATLAVLIITTFNGINLNNQSRQIDEIKSRVEGEKTFSEDLFKELDILSEKSVKSKMAFAGTDTRMR
jgi:hypothetical protein